METDENNIHFMYCFYWGGEAVGILKNLMKSSVFDRTVLKSCLLRDNGQTVSKDFTF